LFWAHPAGVINPPAKNKRHYWVNPNLPANADDWLAGAKDVRGSWWPDYTEWLAQFGGKQVKASSTFGSAKYKKGIAAPGKYVKEKADEVT
jgi:polyhydroxyalkanoate synthase